VTPHKLRQLAVAFTLSGVLVFSGCHKKVAPPTPPAPPPPPPTAPTATIHANPDVIGQGQSTSLVWNTTNATDTTISGIGVVAKSGTQSVTPTESITYTLTAKGPGGTVQANTRVTVNQPPPKPAPMPPSMTEEELFTQNIRDVYFDYDKYDLRSGDSSTVDRDATFLKQHADMKIVSEGHCDDRGSAEYNLALGENRAEALKKALVIDGVDANRLRVVSLGKEKPFCTEDNEQCWQQNRRAHVILDR
jgi:peptidoglycan-associated lipoprotein